MLGEGEEPLYVPESGHLCFGTPSRRSPGCEGSLGLQFHCLSFSSSTTYSGLGKIAENLFEPHLCYL